MAIISNFFARAIAREVAPTPAQWPALVRGTSQTQTSIFSDRQMTLEDFNTLLANALALTGDPGLGLRFGRHSSLLAMGEIGLAGISAPNLLEALRAMADFSRLKADYLDLEIQVGGRQLSFRGSENESVGETRRTQHEVLVLTLQNTIEMVLGRDFTEGRYYFAYPRPDYAGRYREAYHSPCEFDAPATGVDVPWDLMQQPSPFYDEVLWRQGRDRCTSLMAELQREGNQLHSQHVLMLLRSCMPPLPGAVEIAAQMNISKRTLMRRLAEEGVRYRALHDRVLREWSHYYLGSTQLSVDAIAAQLGYQDGANFRRAFRRWASCSPTEYRRRLAGGDRALAACRMVKTP